MENANLFIDSGPEKSKCILLLYYSVLTVGSAWTRAPSGAPPPATIAAPAPPRVLRTDQRRQHMPLLGHESERKIRGGGEAATRRSYGRIFKTHSPPRAICRPRGPVLASTCIRRCVSSAAEERPPIAFPKPSSFEASLA
jgi:hypothetical protein